jgi:hypothetical protein
MKIRKHTKSHLVELADGSKVADIPGRRGRDFELAAGRRPALVRIVDEVSSHALVSSSDNSRVRVLPEGEERPVKQVKGMLGER